MSIRSNLIIATAFVCTLGISACSTSNTQTTALPTKQGTIALDALKVGMPESSIKDALMTFAEDPKGSMGGKTQYLSRAYDNNGGQYVIQCKDGKVFGIQVYMTKGAVAKETALATMHQLMPATSVEPAKIDDSQVKDAKIAQPVEVHNYADGSRGELIYNDKTGTVVGMISGWAAPTAAVGDAGKQL